ncbi:hypothetical protein L6452_14729 [Arctium lappa]|uniref:Uncharacterized protein n=1 Tax=Arctium lappa TaxID=4217 RepID=A0ACB9CMB2_ARCLA|nr:hypothetical protein L6452_14729 [Arctium lappa]
MQRENQGVECVAKYLSDALAVQPVLKGPTHSATHASASLPDLAVATTDATDSDSQDEGFQTDKDLFESDSDDEDLDIDLYDSSSNDGKGDDDQDDG